ncbi:DUF1715-domain-containing protein [Laetiporus sulphureus 93-53]|uniref:DUF1715-domain-containing protein n=1 Tax=Laetiporus sulphureus 93-53 TaxID=1314785 RepID=A0A165C0X1_9APHY|nr:DUF1715-domain-containing protein [Laetiporus sulphureus 93-53]KZT02001.1 DUF1715-domain-containing protein [Laetiporus sulphureus 93-53]
MDFDLESLVNVEQTFYEDGFKDGYEHGSIHGSIEGRALGREKGFEMWEELGFYEGFTMMWQAIHTKEGGTEDRVAHHMRHLLELIAQFPRVNPSASEPSELDIPRLFRQIRSRYKALCASLGVRSTLRAGGTSDARGDGDPIDNAENPRVEGSRRSVWPLQSAATSGEQLSF